MQTIIRRDLSLPLEMIVGADIDAGQADELVAAGSAEPGPPYWVPPVIYLLQPIEIRGYTWPEGAQLHVGGHITEAEALVLLRGVIGVGGVAGAPGGGVG